MRFTRKIEAVTRESMHMQWIENRNTVHKHSRAHEKKMEQAPAKRKHVYSSNSVCKIEKRRSEVNQVRKSGALMVKSEKRKLKWLVQKCSMCIKLLCLWGLECGMYGKTCVFFSDKSMGKRKALRFQNGLLLCRTNRIPRPKRQMQLNCDRIYVFGYSFAT